MRQRLSYARSWAFLLLWLSGTITPVSLVAVAFNEKAFLSSESGASALDTRSKYASCETIAFSLGNRFQCHSEPKIFFRGSSTPTGGRVAPCAGHVKPGLDLGFTHTARTLKILIY